jgi:hypothetical protein
MDDKIILAELMILLIFLKVEANIKVIERLIIIKYSIHNNVKINN